MIHPEKICDFMSHMETGKDYQPVAVTVCATHGVRLEGVSVASTVLADVTAWTLCPVGKVEYAVQQGIDRLHRKLEELEERLREAFPEQP